MDYHPTLRKYFDYSSLRGQQESVVRELLSNHDVLVTAPTGYGKSICFQLPALIRFDKNPQGCVSIVCSPLVSLMQNQVSALRAKRIPVALLSSVESDADNRRVVNALCNDCNVPFALLYVTPERVVLDSFLQIMTKLYKKQRLALMAVDEAHCISQWGHDFRKAYAGLGVVKKRFPLLPVVALTATATPRVKKDILASLNILDAVQIHTSFLRENIRYEVRYADAMQVSVEEDLLRYVKERRVQDGSGAFERGIVYAFKRDTVDAVSHLLQKNGVPAVAYHAGMTPNKRKEAQHKFETGVCPVVVSSCAFGMGIDVSAIRYVVHHSVPKTVEAFYQESGRAGRDGLPSESVLYYSERDAEFNAFLVSKTAAKFDERRTEAAVHAMEAMKAYCLQVKCRRVAVLEYFGEKADAAKVCGKHGCDVCQDGNAVMRRMRIKVTKGNGFGRYSTGGSKPSTPAADFQTARSMLKMQKDRMVEEDWRRREKRPRSVLHNDDIDEFSSEDDFDMATRGKLDKLASSENPSAELRTLARAEEECQNEEMSTLNRPRDRLMARLKGSPETSSLLHNGLKRRKGSLGRVGFRREYGTN